MLRNAPNLVKTEHIGGPLRLRPRLEFCHQRVSSAAQKVEANISSMGIREGCSAKDPGCPHPTLRWLVGAAGGSGSAQDCLCSVCAQDLEMSLPYSQRWCHPFYRRHGLSPGTTKGDRGEKMGEQHEISHVDIFQPFPVGALPACCSRDALVSSGCGQGGDMPPALLSPSLPLLVTVPWDLWALPCPRDRRDVWGLRPPGMVGSVSPTSQHVQKTGTSLSWPRVWGFGYSFWRMKPCRG